MIAIFVYVLIVIGLNAIGFLISLYYRKKPVNMEKVKAYRNYLNVVFLTMFVTLAVLDIAENNIAFFQRLHGGLLISPHTVVGEIFIVTFLIPGMALTGIAHWKKRELKKNRDSE
jgi:hypothetical protein